MRIYQQPSTFTMSEHQSQPFTVSEQHSPVITSQDNFSPSTPVTTSEMLPTAPAPETFLLYHVAAWLGLYGPPIIVSLGTFGNVMTIVIMRRMTSSPESTVNVSLAVMDLIALYAMISNIYTRNMHRLTCQFTWWFYDASTASSAWILVCLTLHRAASVAWPHKVGPVLTHRRVVITITVIVVSFFLVWSHQFYTLDILDPLAHYDYHDNLDLNSTEYLPSEGNSDFTSPEAECIHKPEYLDFHNYYSYVYLTAYSILPFVCLSLANVFLIWKLVTSYKDAAKNLTSGNAEQVLARRKATSAVTLTVVIVSTSFIVLTLPLCVYWSAIYFKFANGEYQGFAYAGIYFLDRASFLLSSLNHAINFYLYCLPGRRFREEFVKVVCGWRSRPRQTLSASSAGLKIDQLDKSTCQTEVVTHIQP